MNAIVFALSFALAQTPAPTGKQSPPPPGTPKDFKLPSKVEFKLDNGMEVTLVPFGNIPKVDAHLVLRTGNIHEAEQQIWLADITADMLEEGTTSRTAEQVNEEAARMGGTVDTAVTPEETVIQSTALGEFAPQLVALVGDVVRNPRFQASEFERVKADRSRDLAIARSQPQPLAQERFLQTLYPGHAFGRSLPTSEMLASFTLDQVKGFYAANYGAQRAHLYVVGRYDEAQVREAITKAFADWAEGPAKRDVPVTPTAKRSVHLLDRPGAEQSTIILGLPGMPPGSPEWIHQTVMNAILGGSFSSRITSNIREQKGYTYSPVSMVTAHRRGAHWAQHADVTTAVTGASLKEIFFELARLQQEPPPEAELQAIKNYLAGTFILSNSSRQGIIGRLRFVDLHDLPDDYLEKYVQNVMAVTPKDIQAAAQKLQPDKMTIVVVGDRKIVEAQLKPFQEGTIAPKR